MIPSVLPAPERQRTGHAAAHCPGLAVRDAPGHGSHGACAHAARRGIDRSLTLALGVAIGFFLRIDTSLAILSGEYQSGTCRDLAWIVPFLCYAWAGARGASLAHRDRRRRHRSERGPSVASAVPLLLIPVIGYGWLQFVSIGDAGDSIRALLTSLLTVGGLGC